MKIHFDNRTLWRLATVAIGLGLTAMMVAPELLAAQSQKLKPYNRGRGLESPVRTPEEREEIRPVRVAGTFRNSMRNGLELDGRGIRVTSRTSIYPSIDGQSYLPNPDDLDGRRATVFGTPGPNGIEAVLVIFTDVDQFGTITPPISQTGRAADARTLQLMPSTTPE